MARVASFKQNDEDDDDDDDDDDGYHNCNSV